MDRNLGKDQKTWILYLALQIAIAVWQDKSHNLSEILGANCWVESLDAGVFYRFGLYEIDQVSMDLG